MTAWDDYLAEFPALQSRYSAALRDAEKIDPGPDERAAELARIEQARREVDLDDPEADSKLFALRDEWLRAKALPTGTAEWRAAQDRVRAAEGEMTAHMFGAFRFPEFREQWQKLGLPMPGVRSLPDTWVFTPYFRWITGVSLLPEAGNDRKCRHMPAVALNPEGGRAVVVSAKVTDDDLTRLLRLSALSGVRKSAVVRRALTLGLDALEHGAGDGHDDDEPPIPNGPGARRSKGEGAAQSPYANDPPERSSINERNPRGRF